MKKINLTAGLLPIVMLAGVLTGCGANDPAEPSPVSKASAASLAPIETPNKKLVEKSEASRFQADCTSKITAKMPDPSAANISYSPLSGIDGYKAEVTLMTQGDGKTMTFDYTCSRTAEGEIVTKNISN